MRFCCYSQFVVFSVSEQDRPWLSGQRAVLSLAMLCSDPAVTHMRVLGQDLSHTRNVPCTLHVCTFVTRKSTRLKGLDVSVCAIVTWIVMNYLLTYLHRLLAVSLCWWRRTWINCRRTVTPSSSDCRTSCTASRMPSAALSKTSSPNCRLYGTRRHCFFASPLVLSSDRHRR